MTKLRSPRIRRSLILAGTALLLFSLASFHAVAQENTATGTGALAADTTGKGNTADGYGTLTSNTAGSYNTAIGLNALRANTTGSRSTSIGASTLHNDIGSDNSAFGYNVLYFNTDGTLNTALGSSALYDNTTGSENTAAGAESLFSNTSGADNVAIGEAALYSNTTGSGNTATGETALYSGTSGTENAAYGKEALYYNTGSDNTASGVRALYSNNSGGGNTATGWEAMYGIGSAGAIGQLTGNYNTAVGYESMHSVDSGSANTAVGASSLYMNNSGSNNTALGWGALANNEGSNNISIGYESGLNAETSANSIYIGNQGNVQDNGAIYIGSTQTLTYVAGIYGTTTSEGVAVYINRNGQLGTVVSSQRFKDDIRDMSDASDVLFSLRPVSFRYKHEIDPQGIAQFGLIAEEVEKIDPALVVHDADGKPYSVRYEQVNAMLLNEFLKEHKLTEQQRVQTQEQQAVIDRLKASEADDRHEIAVLTAALKEQASLIQKVSAEVELAGQAPRTAANTH
jgi:hypothetical protein